MCKRASPRAAWTFAESPACPVARSDTGPGARKAPIGWNHWGQNMRRVWTVSWILNLVLGACDGGGGGDPCADLAAPCTSEGEERCATDSSSTERCSYDADGCLGWRTDHTCAAPEACVLVDGAATCAAGCQDTCETIGETRCTPDDTGTERCEVGADGCQAWVVHESCAPSQSCVAGLCRCDDTCPDAGATQCVGSVKQRCVADAAGCLAWTDGADCAASGQVCLLDGGVASCAPCEDGCPAGGAQGCQGQVLVTCSTQAGGCLGWSATMDCAASGLVCLPANGAVRCVGPCQDACPENGWEECQGTVIAICEVQADGCLDWGVLLDCAETGSVCEVVGGQYPGCAFVCQDACPIEGAQECQGQTIAACTLGADGCLHWFVSEDCAALEPPQECVQPGGAPSCAPPPERLCADGLDEDGDGLSDCQDPDCALAPACFCDGVTPLIGPGTPVAEGDLTAGAGQFVGSCGGNGNEATFCFSPAQAGIYQLDTLGSFDDLDTLLYVFGPQGELACNDDYDAGSGSYQSAVTVDLAQDETVTVVLDTYGPAMAGAYMLNISVVGK
jgi:hypothetical protein